MAPQKKIWPGILSRLVIGLGLVVMFNLNVFGQVTITKPSLSFDACNAFPIGFQSLGNIVITETVRNDFADAAGTYSIILTAPTDFEFNTSSGTASLTGTHKIFGD